MTTAIKIDANESKVTENWKAHLAEATIPDAVLPVQVLRNLLDSVAFAADGESASSRHAFGCVRLEFADGKVTAIGCDGRRLAWRTVPVHVCEPFNLQIPLKDAKALAGRITEHASGDASIYAGNLAIDGQHVDVNWSGHRRKAMSAEFVTLEGRYPNWRQIIDSPPAVTCTITASAGALLELVDFDLDVFRFDLDRGRLERVRLFDLDQITVSGQTAGVDFYADVNLIKPWLQSLPAESSVEICVADSHHALHASADNGSRFVFMPCNPPDETSSTKRGRKSARKVS